MREQQGIVLCVVLLVSLPWSSLAQNWDTEENLRTLAVFSFDNQEDSAIWGEQVGELEGAYDEGDESAAALVKQIYNVWRRKFQPKDQMSVGEGGLNTFTKNMWSVGKTNVKNFKGYPENKNKYWQSLNTFADLTFEEFEKHYLMKNSKIDFDIDDIVFKPLPLRKCVNWSLSDKLTPVKNQGACGSCWAFSAIAAVESNYLIKSAKKYSTYKINLSEQQIVDCVSSPRTDTSGVAYNSGGCGGGWSTEAFNFIRKYGVYKESLYPYTSGTTGSAGKCRLDFRRQSEMRLKRPNPAWGRVSPSSNPKTLQTALATQVVSHYLRVEAPFQLYNGGIFNTPCSKKGINHATLLYGYCDYFIHIEDKFPLDHWMIKNSWGTGWGEKGKMRMAITSGDGICESQKYGWIHNTPYWVFRL